jgi:carbamoyltransferase
MSNKQYISFCFTGHDANISVYSEKLNKFYHFELERIFGLRYFIMENFSDSQKTYVLQYIKNIILSLGFEETFDVASLLRHHPFTDEGLEKDKDFLKSSFKILDFVSYNHHECHAASAFYLSKFESSLIVSYDGYGNDGNFCIFHGDNNGIKKQNPYTLTGLTEFYAYVGDFISEIKKKDNDSLINALSNPGKLMGLSAYGSFDKNIYDPIYDLFQNTIKLGFEGDHNTPFYFRNKHLGTILNKKISEYSNTESVNIAYNTQLAFENFFIDYFKQFFDSNIHKNVCITGGGALNVLLNERLSKMYPNTNFFVPPAPSDCGLSYGSMCLMLKSSVVNETMYSGCPILDEEILPNILMYRSWKSTDIKKVAEDIYTGKIVGLCQGQSEVGPRALGHRSILADARQHNMKDTINKKVKFREWFRPFAPICCEEDANKYFEISNNVNYKYMSFSPKVKKEFRNLLTSITHIDGTSRLQTINYNQNPYVYELLREFEKLSGVPILINTSFNIKGKPILTHYQAALQNLDSSELDGVILDKYYITK